MDSLLVLLDKMAHADGTLGVIALLKVAVCRASLVAVHAMGVDVGLLVIIRGGQVTKKKPSPSGPTPVTAIGTVSSMSSATNVPPFNTTPLRFNVPLTTSSLSSVSATDHHALYGWKYSPTPALTHGVARPGAPFSVLPAVVFTEVPKSVPSGVATSIASMPSPDSTSERSVSGFAVKVVFSTSVPGPHSVV